MDIEKLIVSLRSPSWQDLEDPDETLLEDAATALSMIPVLQAENDELKAKLYDGEGVNLVDYWMQQAQIEENGHKNCQAENEKLRYEVERQRRSADDRQHLYENAERAYMKVLAELEQYHALGPIDHLRELARADREGITPCTFCRFNPPSSGDGKPCTCCPATGRPPEGEVGVVKYIGNGGEQNGATDI